MPTNFTDSPATSSANDLLEGILNASLNGIIAYESVRDATGTIVDFRAVLINRVAQQILHLPDTEPGWQLLALFPAVKEHGLFDQYVSVVETGESLRFETPYQNENFSGWYDVAVVKLGDGFVITFNDITVQHRAKLEIEAQNTLLDGILDTSTSTVIVYDAIRDETGQILDFRLRLANSTARAEIQKYFNLDPTGRTLLEINPNVRQKGRFNRYVEVVNTGQAVHQEQFYADLNVWYDTHIAKLGDGIVITATEVTAQKQAQQELERQTELTQTMLDGAINGVLLLKPIYDDKNELTDFTILAANPAVEKLTGVAPEEAIGRTMTATYPGYREAGFFALYCDAFLGQPGRTENYYEDEKGLRGWFEVSAVRQADTLVLTFDSTSNFRLAEQELKQAATNLQAVIDNSQTGIFVFSPVRNDAGEVVNFRFKAINKMVAALIGETPDAIRGDLASNWFISYRDTETYTRYKTTLATGEEQRFDINYNVDGLDVWFDVRSVKLNDDVLVTFTDYTDLKQLQLAQEKQTNLLNSVLNGTPNGIMAFEAIRNKQGVIIDLLITSTNSVGAGIAGKPIDELIGFPALTNFPGIKPTGLFDLYADTIETGEPMRQELHYQTDGLDVFVEVKTSKLGDGLVVTYNDVTEDRKLSLQIEQQASLLSSVLDGSINGIMAFEAMRNDAGEITDFRFLTMNEASGQLVGRTEEEVIGKPLLPIFPGNVESGLFAQYVHTTNTGEPTRTEVDYRHDGLDFWLDISARKINDGFVVTFTDVSALKRLQQQLEASVIDLQRSNKNLEQFAYVASHDLQEPLRKIQQFGDILQTNYTAVLDESGQDMLRRMQSAAERMRVLVKDVLAYSRIATKRENEKAIDLNQLLRDVASDLETAILEKNALILVDTLPIIAGDAAQLRQLFQNLMSNALKFTKPGRQPELQLRYTVQRGRDTGLPVSAHDNAVQFYRFELSDNGIGFDPHQAEKIFQVFQRLHNRNEYQGTGIGLAIVQKVIDNHRGYIRAEGQPGHGATFTILIPV